MVRIRSLLYSLRESFWFLPSLLVLLAVSLHFLLDAVEYPTAAGFPRLFSGEAEGARVILSVIAGSIVTVAGVVFSVTMVTLSIASSQFGPRLIRSFMRDLATQFVLGIQIATFVFALLALRRIEVGADVPQASFTAALAFAVASIALLIFFIHHVASSVQPEMLVSRLGRELQNSIKSRIDNTGHLRRRQPDDDPETWRMAGRTRDEGAVIASTDTGYVKAIDYDGLAKVARAADCYLVMLASPGTFAAPGTPIAAVSPPEKLTPRLERRVQDALVLSAHRTLEQDVAFGIIELVDVAVRALSPGVNTPFLAALCVNYMGAALARFGEEASPDVAHPDKDGTLRVYLQEPDFATLMATAYSEVRRHGAGSMPVIETCYKTFNDLAGRLETDSGREAVARQANLLYAAALDRIQEPTDRLEITATHEGLMEKLGQPPPARDSLPLLERPAVRLTARIALALGEVLWGMRRR